MKYMKEVVKFLNAKLENFVYFLVLGTAVLLPIILLPLSDNFLITSKFYLVFAVTIIIVLAWTIFVLLKKSVQFTLSPFVLPLLALAIVTLISLFASTQYPAAQLMGFGGLYVALAVLVILTTSIISQKQSKILIDALTIPALILSVATGAELLGWGPSRVINILLKTQFPNSPIFSLSGSPLITLQFLIMVLAGIIALRFASKKKLSPFYILSGAIILAGIFANGYTIYQAQKTVPIFMPFGAAWSIALDCLKTVRTSLIGFGPDNYSKVYLLFKPQWMNTTSAWSVQFLQANNLPFTLLGTIGLLGLLAWLFLVIQAVRTAIKPNTSTLSVAVVFFAGIILELFFPPNALILSIQALALIFWVLGEKHLFKDMQLHAFTVHFVKADGEPQRVPHHSNSMAYITALVSSVVVAALLYYFVPAMVGEFLIFEGEMAAARNQAVNVYNFQRDAITWNPYYDLYRRKYSATNMAIALAINNAKDNNPDKDKVVTLIQQSIQEALAAKVLDNQNSFNWLNLGRIYNNLIGVADQADQLTIQAYSNAITLAPNDPVLQLELGGILLRTGKYTQAAQVFDHVTALKPDWPNAYYNSALAYRQLQQFDKAIVLYQKTLSLLDSTSEDYAKVKAELDDVQKQLTAKQTAKPTSSPSSTSSTAPPVVPKTAPQTLVAPTVNSSVSGQLSSPKTKSSLSSPQPSPTL